MGCLQALKGLPQSMCETNLAGIKKVYIANYENVDFAGVTFSGSTDTPDGSYVITSGLAMTGSTKFYAYNFAKQTGSLTSTLTKDETNGTRYYTNVVALQFSKLEARKHLEFSALAADPTALIVVDNNGKKWLIGYDNYASATEGTAQTGQSFDDLNGYNISLSAQSAYLPIEITQDITALVEEVDA